MTVCYPDRCTQTLGLRSYSSASLSNQQRQHQLRREAPIPCTPVMTSAASQDTVAGQAHPAEGGACCCWHCLPEHRYGITPPLSLATCGATHLKTPAWMQPPPQRTSTHTGGRGVPAMHQGERSQHPCTCVLRPVDSTRTCPRVCLHTQHAAQLHVMPGGHKTSEAQAHAAEQLRLLAPMTDLSPLCKMPHCIRTLAWCDCQRSTAQRIPPQHSAAHVEEHDMSVTRSDTHDEPCSHVSPRP